MSRHHRNKTGLYMAQGMYIPGHDKKSVIPPMLYRGHVVRIARGTEQNYYNHVVHRYPMHNVNSGFMGSKVPVKDQTKFKIPHERRYHDKTHGKWTNFPMTVEMQRYTKGHDMPLLNNPQPVTIQDDTGFIFNSHMDPYQRPTTTPVDRRLSTKTPSEFTVDPDANDLYESLEPEITNLMAARNEVFQSYQQRVEHALYNDINQSKSLQSLPTSRLGIYSEMKLDSKACTPRPKTSSFIVEDNQTNLLLPVPFVSSNRLVHRISTRSYSAPVTMNKSWH